MAATLETFIAELRAGHPVAFRDTLALIDEYYDYQPTRFWNGVGIDVLVNEPGINEGSCRVFAFAQLQGLSEPETLALFGEYYRDEVLPNPEGDGHKNIRNFMKHGWAGIAFDGPALRPRS